jgi:hypothetical protein
VAHDGEAISDILRLTKTGCGECDDLVINNRIDDPTTLVPVNHDLKPIGVTTQKRHNQPTLAREARLKGESKSLASGSACGENTALRLTHRTYLIALLRPAKIAGQNCTKRSPVFHYFLCSQ